VRWKHTKRLAKVVLDLLWRVEVRLRRKRVDGDQDVGRVPAGVQERVGGVGVQCGESCVWVCGCVWVWVCVEGVIDAEWWQSVVVVQGPCAQTGTFHYAMT
jgi:hypothetical protein